MVVKGVLLRFDAAQMKASVEKIALEDGILKSSWGEAVWRVRLTSVGGAAKESWKLEMVEA
jgi:hypothetical protein